MRATEILKNEHCVIELVLSCLESMAEDAIRRGKLDGEAAGQAIDFFKTFADGCHHTKEEEFLFPLMEEKGFPRRGGPTGVMLHEHEIGREQIAAMTESLTDAAQSNPKAVRRFASHAQTYVDLLRQHIFKENQVLFPMADRAFTSDDQQTLLSKFEALEEQGARSGKHEAYIRMANTLAEKFHVQPAAPDIATFPMCGSCAGGHAVR